ncbi:protein NLP6-like isoform X2 [Salvia hispanica]|uniref:protein NLP6-like isoform X2 n=1 Tax=Salvia hispanica TaxID=49212 RepID=UPI0020096EFC|nr:protein NLP6-like isoform X2 [Salvia hispanica]
MDDERRGVLSILSGGDDWFAWYSSITDFKPNLGEEDLIHEELAGGWVLYETPLSQLKIMSLLRFIASSRNWMVHFHCLMQFWRVVKVEGSHHHLSCSHLPFYVTSLNKGLCRLRKLCINQEYVAGGDDEKQLGGVGWVYRNRLPESTPDLRLYSTHEFPMRDEAARCGFRAYMALPLFDSHTFQFYGVLEIFQRYNSLHKMNHLLSVLDGALQFAGLRSNHKSIAITKEMRQPGSEISQVLELVMATIPRIYLAQVWIPCNKQCVNIFTNLCCMEMVSFIDSQTKIFNSWSDIDVDMHDYLEACEFHNLQIDLHSFHSTLCGLTISENSTAHYVQRARMSHFIAVSHKSNDNNLYCVIQFFLRAKYTRDDHSLHLLLRILEINLKSVSVMFVSGKQLLEEYVRPNAIECESIDTFSLIKSYKQNFLELDVTTYLKTIDSCYLKPSSTGTDKGWIFCLPAEQSVCEEHVESNSWLVKMKMEGLMEKIATKSSKHNNWIVQFWAPKMENGRCCLKTLYQPYAVSYLAKGVASFRKQCMENYYFVDDEAKQDELGPPGRVFRFKHPEISPDLFYYTREEFPMRNFAMVCCNRGYLVLPVFENEGIGNHKIVGVLEFLGFYHSDLPIIEKLMKIFNGTEKALREIRNVLILINVIPQLYMTNVWVPTRDCGGTTNSNRSCMELTFSTNDFMKSMATNSVHGIHVQARKGMIGMVLASENKSCFCPNLSEFSIVDHPMSHYDMRDRRDVCFAICLQSSDTGNLVYVMEFFLYQGPATRMDVGSFLSLLLPIIKHALRSFKLACGKHLGEELVVEVIEFSDANKLDSSELEPACVYPIIFKSVQYNLKGCHHTEVQLPNEYHHIEEEQHAEECNEEQQNVYHHAEEEQHANECPVEDSYFNAREREKRKNSLNLSTEVLESHFGKKLKDVAKELGVGRSTIKRACREHGIQRWPNRIQHKKNPSLFEEESAADLEQDMLPSTDNFHPLDNVTQINTGRVIVKVKYKEDLIKFELSLSLLGLAKLSEEVAKSLNLEMGSFKLKYMDEDGDEILISRDVDLQLCPKTRTTKVAEVHGRTFGVWTLLICTLFYLCAFNLDDKPLYFATFVSFTYAFGHFLSEYLIYHTMAIENLTTVGIFVITLV